MISIMCFTSRRLPYRTYRPILAPKQEATYCKAALIAVCLIAAVFGLLSFGSHRSSNWFVARPLNQEEFIAKMYQASIDTCEPAPITAYCAHDKWNNSAAISCDGISGDTCKLF